MTEYRYIHLWCLRYCFSPLCEDYLHVNLDIILSVYTVFVTSTFVLKFVLHFFIRISAMSLFKGPKFISENILKTSQYCLCLPASSDTGLNYTFFICYPYKWRGSYFSHVHNDGGSPLTTEKLPQGEFGQRYLLLFTTFFPQKELKFPHSPSKITSNHVQKTHQI